MNQLIKYLLLFVIGILIYYISNNRNGFNIGIPKRDNNKITISWIGNPPNADLIDSFENIIFEYNPDIENVNWLPAHEVPPGGAAFGFTTQHIQVQNILINYVQNAITYALDNLNINVPEDEEDDYLTDQIYQLFAFLLSFGNISLMNPLFLIWLLDTNINEPFIDLFRDNLRDELLRNLITITFSECVSSYSKKQKIN